MMTSSASLVRELVRIVTEGVQPPPDAADLAALHAKLRRQIQVVGPAVAEAAVRRLADAPGPACIATRRAKFCGVAAVLASAR